MDEGDPLGALPWFAEALTRDQDDPARAANHRIRIESILRQTPRLVQVWFGKGGPEFSPDGRYVLMRGGDGTQVCEVATGEPVRLLGPRVPGFVTQCFSPDGRRVLTAGTLGARVFDVASGKLVLTLEEKGVLHAEFSPDGSRLLTSHGRAEVRVWDAATGHVVAKFPSKNQFSATHGPHESLFSPDGRHVVTVEPEEQRDAVRIRELATGKVVGGVLPELKKVDRASFSRDGRRLLTESSGVGPVEMWDAATGARVSSIRDFPIHAGRVSMTTNGSGILRSSQTDYRGGMPFSWARLWDANTGAPVGSTLRHPTEIRSASLPPYGRLLEGPYGRWAVATGCADGKVRIWNAETGTLMRPVLHDAAEVRHVSFSPGLGHLLTASGAGGFSCAVRVWDLLPERTFGVGWQPRFPNLRREVGPSARHLGAFSPDGRRSVTSGKAPRIRDLATKQDVILKHDADVFHVAYSPNGRCVLTVGDDGTARVWDANSGELVAGPLKHGAPILHASFHPQGGSLVTTGKDGAARVWKVPSGDLLFPVLRHKSPDVFRADFSADGRLLLTVAGKSTDAVRWWGYPREGRVWNAATGEPIMTLPSGRAALSPNGDRVAIFGSAGAQVLTVPGGKATIAPLRHGADVSDAAFSPDGRWIVTACDDGTARVWDTVTGNPVTPPLQHQHRVCGGFFSPDSRLVFTYSDDFAWRVWDAATGEALTVPFRGFSGVAWDVSPPDRPVTDLVQWAELLSGSRLDQNGKLVRLESAELQARWLGYRTKYLGQPGPAQPEDNKLPSPKK